MLICKKMYNPVFFVRMKNRRKIAAKQVFAVFGNSDVQTGFSRFCAIACGSECRRFESVRAPKQETSLFWRCLFLFQKYD